MLNKHGVSSFESTWFKWYSTITRKLLQLQRGCHLRKKFENSKELGNAPVVKSAASPTQFLMSRLTKTRFPIESLKLKSKNHIEIEDTLQQKLEEYKKY